MLKMTSSIMMYSGFKGFGRLLRATILLASLFGLAATGSHASAEISQNILDYVPKNLDDFTATMTAQRYDAHAGEKINKDFGLIYQLKGDVSIKYKEENKLRLEAKVGSGKIILIVNNTTQYTSALGARDVRDLGNTPGKRKTLLDAGFISKGYLAIAEAEFKRTQVVKGVECALFRLSYKDKSLDTSHRLLWIDPKTKVVVKREEYSQAGKLNATYYYLNPKEVDNGVWFPTRIEAYNRDNKEAGVTVYRDIKVNQELDDRVFRL